ncbi:MAG: cobalamin B12-binding domain-containing protein [Dehalobacterium sp.]
MPNKKQRILLAKPGLDGHDKGVRLVAMALRDAGIEVIYLGLRQSAEDIVNAAIQEDVDFIGLSILSGVHLNVADKVLKRIKELSMGNCPLVIGGIIPPQDMIKLKNMGVAAIFPVGSSFEDIVQWIKKYPIEKISGGESIGR